MRKSVILAVILMSGVLFAEDYNPNIFYNTEDLQNMEHEYMFDPIYQDKNLNVWVSFMRIKGEIEFLALLNSFYEYTDVRMLLLNYFGGTDRIIEPSFFSSFIILPEDLVNYEYTNEYTGLKYKIDWFGA